MSDESIDVLLSEGRTFPPPREFSERALIGDTSLYDHAERDLDGFWLHQTRRLVGWFQEPETALEWQPPHGNELRRVAKCFSGLRFLLTRILLNMEMY